MYCDKVAANYTIVGLINAIGKMQLNTYNKSNPPVTFMQTNMDSL